MRDIEAGTYAGEPTFCTVNAYGDCPYCDQCGICHIDNPMEDCDDFGIFFNYSWDEWLALDNYEPDEALQWEDYDVGFDPYMGMYTDDC